MEKKRLIGRPKGKEPSLVINVRMPISLLQRLDHYLDRRGDAQPGPGDPGTTGAAA